MDIYMFWLLSICTPLAVWGVPDFKSPGEEQSSSPTSKAIKLHAPGNQDQDTWHSFLGFNSEESDMNKKWQWRIPFSRGGSYLWFSKAIVQGKKTIVEAMPSLCIWVWLWSWLSKLPLFFSVFPTRHLLLSLSCLSYPMSLRYIFFPLYMYALYWWIKQMNIPTFMEVTFCPKNPKAFSTVCNPRFWLIVSHAKLKDALIIVSLLVLWESGSEMEFGMQDVD